jgi:putative restriction endonuclease
LARSQTTFRTGSACARTSIASDNGYVTVTPDLRFEVGRRLREDFENGRDYYALGGRSLIVVPGRAENLPSLEALEWHATNVFRG